MENQDQGTAARTLGQAASALASPISRGLHQLVCVSEPNPPALRCALEGWTRRTIAEFGSVSNQRLEAKFGNILQQTNADRFFR